MKPPPLPPHGNGKVNAAPWFSSVKSETPEPFVGFSTSCVENGKRYSLQVPQQPERARVAALKDRHKISPPPCIRLVVQDEITQEERDISDIDIPFFVLMVELWSDDGKREVTITPNSSSRSASPQEGSALVMNPRASLSDTFTRNLDGSRVFSASKLTCLENKTGVWFPLSHLSVQQEGKYRLKLKVLNLKLSTSSQSLNNGISPVLASIFSDIFTVYSAREYPGVVGCTDLSKCFRLQGVKVLPWNNKWHPKEEAKDS